MKFVPAAPDNESQYFTVINNIFNIFTILQNDEKNHKYFVPVKSLFNRPQDFKFIVNYCDYYCYFHKNSKYF